MPTCAIRQKAQFELVAARRRADAPRRGERTDANQLARIHGVWGIAQLRAPEGRGEARARCSTPFLTDADAEIRAQAAKMIGDVRYAPAAVGARSAARGHRPAGAVLRGRSARPHRLQAGSGRRSSRCSPPTTTRTSTCGTPAASRCRGSATRPRSGRCRRIRRAACASPPSSRCGACAVPRSARFLTDSDECDRHSRRHARSMTTGRSRRRCRRWRVCLATSGCHGEPLVRRAISANLRVGIG